MASTTTGASITRGSLATAALRIRPCRSWSASRTSSRSSRRPWAARWPTMARRWSSWPTAPNMGGDNAYKQLDAGASAAQLTPLRLRPPAGVTYSILAANGGTTYEITTANDVYARGWGRWGQIGDGSRANASKPVMVLSGMSLISATAKNVVVAC